MHPYEFNLSFRLTHPSEDLRAIYEKISTIPGFIPGRIWKAGEERQGQQGQNLEGVYEKSYCYFDCFNTLQKSTTESLSVAIEKILILLVPFKEDIQEHVRSGGKAEFFAGLYVDSNAGETFNPELMKKLADFGIQLSIDIYPPDQK